METDMAMKKASGGKGHPTGKFPKTVVRSTLKKSC
jgi:hypothetical protein